MKVHHQLSIQQKRQRRVRAKLHGTAVRPRIVVTRSNRYLSAQVVDDDARCTLAAATTRAAGKTASKKVALTKTAATTAMGAELAKQMQTKKITAGAFDRGAYRYHGRVKALAEALRAGGITL